MELLVVLAFLLLLNVLSAAGLTVDSRISKRCDDYAADDPHIRPLA
ncbi:hypothetical protein F4553_000440 [Allocatelliglobosispora scoriae]|uniref:Uncharacterized protein n=1 Tax=Allocatelliglobosispora scoriae TaxID=643052 RepID=A0A841BJI5_9ACTN|nr:hypothetical protein [Allocatelliglobosispora scoriae]MBB5867061.1 hypothetical protein [Allocatelliglobosispora scoriae]